MRHFFTLVLLLIFSVGLSTPALTQTARLKSPPTSLIRPLTLIRPTSTASSQTVSIRESSLNIVATATINVRYVKEGGTGDGSSWSNPSGDLQAMIDKSASGDQVWITKGIYKPTSTILTNPRLAAFSLKNGVGILGGFTGVIGTEGNVNSRIAIPSSTTLSGEIGNEGISDNCFNVILNFNNGLDNSALLDGVIITGGNANANDPSSSQYYGGGMANIYSSPTILNCLFILNSANTGGAIHNFFTTDLKIINCSFINNKGQNVGGVYEDYSINSTLINCFFGQNSSNNQGGALAGNGNPVSLINCSFNGNQAPLGGAIYLQSSTANLVNCLLWRNGGQSSIVGSSLNNASYCLIETGETDIINQGHNQILTSSPFANDFSPNLLPVAPAVDAGNDAVNSTMTDVLGNARRVKAIDIGAAEFGGNVCSPPSAPTLVTQAGHSYPAGISSLTISQNVGPVILSVMGCEGGTLTWSGGDATIISVSTFDTGLQTFTATCTQNGCISQVATATVLVVPTTLSVLHRDGNGNINTNTLAPYLQLQNDGNTAIPYSETTVRYWLTMENYMPLLFSINYAQLGSDKVHLKYVPASTGNPTATGYIEFSFDESAGNLAARSNSGPIQDLINKQDYSYFDQSNDYSYAPVGNFTPNNRITAYRNGVLFHGLEPGPVVPMQSVKAMLQNNTGEGANSIEAVLSVTNDGNVPINYGDIKVRYYFTPDNAQPLVLSQAGYTALGSGNVSAQIVTISPALAGADRYLELSFSPSLGQLAPGASTGGVTYQIRHADYSGFTQTNDYSYQGTGGTMVNSHVVVFVAGVRAYGTEPGTGARLSAENVEAPLRVQVLGNPVHGTAVEVVVSGAEGQPLTSHLTDLNGRSITTRQVERAGVTEAQRLEVGGAPAGMLLLRVSTPTQSQTVKVLRQ